MIRAFLSAAPAADRGNDTLAAVIGYGIVLLAIALAAVIVFAICRKVMNRIKNAPEAQAEGVTAETPAAAAPMEEGDSLGVCMGNRVCRLHKVDDKTAAMIMAVVADETKIPLNELRFISIKEL